MTQDEHGMPEDEQTADGGADADGAVVYGLVNDPDELNWSTLVHLSGLAGFLGFIFPFGNVIAPLAIWLLLRARSDMVDVHGKQALNFHISMTLYASVALFFSLVIIGIPFLIGIILFTIYRSLLAALRASRGDPPGYILAIPFFR